MENRTRLSIKIGLFVLVAFGLWNILYAQRQPTQTVAWTDGVLDLTDINLDTTIALLPVDWDFYPNGLYAPAEIAEGHAGDARKFAGIEDERTYSVGTYHAKLRLPPGQFYAIAAYSLDYATQIYVDGQPAHAVGEVAPDAEGFVPRTAYYTMPLYPQGEYTDIALQYANFVHREGGAMRQMALSSPMNIDRYNHYAMVPTYLLSGGLVLLAGYYLLQALVYRRKEAFAFALCCIFLSMRSSRLVLSLLSPDYNWQVFYRSFYLGSSLVGFLFMYLLTTLYPRLFARWVLRLYGALLFAADVAVVFVPITVAVRMLTPLGLSTLPPVLYFVARLMSLWRNGKGEDGIAVVGALVYCVSLIMELLLSRSMTFVTRSGLTPFGMMGFVFCYMLLLGIRQNRDSAELGIAQARIQDLHELNDMKTRFLTSVSHDMKTPLAVVSGYAQDTDELLDIMPPDTALMHANQQRIIEVAEHTADLVDDLLDVTAIEQGRLMMRMESASFADLAIQVYSIHFPMMNANGNTLVLDIPDLPPMQMDVGRIRQVLLNLIGNAAKHTQNGVITLKARAEQGTLCVMVSDAGAGFAPQLLDIPFEQLAEHRGGLVKGNGFGLYISRHIVRAHGGEMRIENLPEGGAAVTFTLRTQPDEEEML